MKQKAEITTDTMATESLRKLPEPPSPTDRCHARLLLMRLFAHFVPGAGHCQSLSTEEEIIECMAKRHPYLFIT
jgi:hypothetical protein